MKTTRIEINKLVPHESAATKSRVDSLSKLDKIPPITVKAIPGTEYFYIIDGTNRAYVALKSGALDIEAIVATPDFSNRLNNIYNQKIIREPLSPLSSLCLEDSDIERQHRFFLDTEPFSNRPNIKTNRGTIIKLKVTTSYDNVEDTQFTLAQKGNIGGLILNPHDATYLFKNSFLNNKNILECWGDDTYEPETLPSYIEIGTNGKDYWAGGYVLRQAFRDVNSSYPFSVTKRGRVTAVNVFVIYPNGLVYEGPIEISNNTTMILWSEELICNLVDPSYTIGYSPSPHWWKNPTSLLINSTNISNGIIEDIYSCSSAHSCGSTCVGGGCLV